MYDELIKRIRNRRICIQQSGSLDDFPLLQEAADAIVELSKPRWIPVKERLPRPNKMVLVVNILDDRGVAVLKDWGEWVYVREGGIDYPQNPITHWMPLPELPKEGEKE